MLNFSRRDQPADTHETKSAGKPGLRPAAVYEPPGSPAAGFSNAPVRALPPDPGPAKEIATRVESAHASQPGHASHPPAHASHPGPATSASDAPGSKLFVGVNIKLKGVEISDCDILVVEGNVEATVHTKVMQIAKPGTLQGTALIDVAEVHGEFTGELTARTRLVVHGTGRVSGTIRYGRLIVEDGGTLSGDVRQLDPAEVPAPPAPQTPPPPARRGIADPRTHS
jgi:cytoskeletal protein CcmA (bactofilin family)